MLIDHPVTYMLKTVQDEKPLENAEQALALAQALKEYNHLLPDRWTVDKSLSRLIDFLKSNKRHTVKCRHSHLEKDGAKGYRCTNCTEKFSLPT